MENMIFPYVSSVTLSEDRTQPNAMLSATIPPYPAEKMILIKPGSVIRWEAGYWEDHIPLNKTLDGYHTEFEGIITGVSKNTESDSSISGGNMNVSIEALDYMFLLSQTEMGTGGKEVQVTGDMTSVVQMALTAGGLQATYNLKFYMLCNPALFILSGSANFNATTAGECLNKLKGRVTSEGNFNADSFGLGIFFRGKDLLIQDATDPSTCVFRNPESGSAGYPVFVTGQNVIDSSVSSIAVQPAYIQATWKDLTTGNEISSIYPTSGTTDFNRLTTTYPDRNPPTLGFKVDADASGKQPNLMKRGQQIFTALSGDGFEGSFTTFGYPPVHRGDLILYAGDEPELQKGVIVDNVSKTYDSESATFRQTISPGRTPCGILNPNNGNHSNVSRLETYFSIFETNLEYESRVKSILQAIRAGGAT